MNTLKLSLALTAALGLSIDAVRAGCNCNRGGGGAVSGPMMSTPVMSAPMMAPPMMSAPMMAPQMAAPPMAPPPMAAICANAKTPPGTLGRTYCLCSRPLPEDEHPRNAGLEIQNADGCEIVVEKMEGFRDADGLWYFVTEKPWLPTQPAIVKVVISRTAGGSMVRDVRTVRLIPGRILTVQF